MRLFALVSAVVFSSIPAFSQGLVSEQFYNARKKKVNNSNKAVYFERVYQLPDGTLESRFGRLDDGVVLRQESLINDAGKTYWHGKFFTLKESSLDTISIQYYDRNEPVGKWLKGGQTLDYDFSMAGLKGGKDVFPIVVAPAKRDTAYKDGIFRVVEEMPVFPGGIPKMYEWINSEIFYPVIAIENNVEGVVHLEFVVNEQGLIESIKVIRSPHIALSKEAARVLRQMPKWKPGYQRGKPVKVYYNIPIRFQLK